MQAVDFVTAPSVDECVAAGVFPCPYTGNARPSQGWFDEGRAKGVAPLWMIQETISSRSQQGFQAGVFDCEFAEGRARERGHDGALAVVVSDGNGRDAWDASGYGQGWASVATLRFFAYGAVGVIATFESGAACPLLIPGGWIPETWGHGVVASQLVGPQAAISTAHDLNDVFYDFGTQPVPPVPPVGVDMVYENFSTKARIATLGAGYSDFDLQDVDASRVTVVSDQAFTALKAAADVALAKIGGQVVVDSGPSVEQIAALKQAHDALVAVETAFK